MKAVVFDLWNTLVQPDSQTFTQLLAESLDMDEDNVRDYIRSSSSRQNIDYLQIVQEMWHYTHKEELPTLTLEKIKEACRVFADKATLISGAANCLRELRESNYKLAIVSNSTSVSYGVVKSLGLDDLVDDVFLSCSTGILKPDPRAFYKPVKKWRIDPKDIYVIGDKITTDVLGAKLARMHFIWYAPNITVKRDFIPVDIVGIVRSLQEIPKTIKLHQHTEVPTPIRAKIP